MKYLFKNFPLAIILMIAILIMLFKDYRKPAIIFCSIDGICRSGDDDVGDRQDVQLCRHCRDIGVDRNDHKERYRADGRDHFADRAGDGAGHRLDRQCPEPSAAGDDGGLDHDLRDDPLLTDAMFGSLAASIMGGLLFGTVITLVFIPVLYALFFHIKHVD